MARREFVASHPTATCGGTRDRRRAAPRHAPSRARAASAQVTYEDREVTSEQRAELARIVASGGNAGARRASAVAAAARGAGLGARAAKARLLALAQRGDMPPLPEEDLEEEEGEEG